MDNPEVDKNTPQYDEQLAGQVLSFIRKLDRKLWEKDLKEFDMFNFE